MNTFTEIVLTIAGLLYISSHLRSFVRSEIRNTRIQLERKIDEAHSIALEAVKVPFDFWWENEGKAAAAPGVERRLMEELRELLPVALSLPDNFTKMIPVEQFLESVEQDALHIAIHAHMQDALKKVVRSMPRFGGMRALGNQYIKEHDEILDQHRLHLLEIGLDVEAIEQRFTTSP